MKFFDLKFCETCGSLVCLCQERNRNWLLRMYTGNFPERHAMQTSGIYEHCPGCGAAMLTDGGKRFYCDDCWSRIMERIFA